MNTDRQLSNKILKIIGQGLLITVASLIAPTIPYILLRGYLKNKFRTHYHNRQITDGLRYLKRKKFIAFERKQNKLRVIVTKIGRVHLAKASLDDIQIKPVSWDGHWRLLTFDIPEAQRAARRTFNRKLHNLGFFHFQRSVFILPYPCQMELNEVTEILNIREHVYIITCDRFEGDNSLVKKFKLK